jgi:23S rRNA (uridine2552-2'-O)-methyltransferase
MKGQPDYYWRKSKQEGFPARSVFKLQEIQEKYRLIRPGNTVLDLGASPGSWSLYILGLLAGSGSVTGADLNAPDKALLSRKGYRFLQGDFTSPDILRAVMEAAPYDVVVSDAAPSTTGNRTLDTTRSLELARQVLAIAEKALRPGGHLTLKIFQGGGEKEILDWMRGRFALARAFKPKASRRDSMETYFVGTGFAPVASLTSAFGGEGLNRS